MSSKILQSALLILMVASFIAFLIEFIQGNRDVMLWYFIILYTCGIFNCLLEISSKLNKGENDGN